MINKGKVFIKFIIIKSFRGTNLLLASKFARKRGFTIALIISSRVYRFILYLFFTDLPSIVL